MIKRVTSGITAFLLSVSSLLVFAPSVAHAAVRTWDGSAGDNKFSTASNWSDGTVPTNGDSVVFPLSAASYTDVDIVQDISGLSLSGISFTGDAGSNCNGQYARYNISGAALTLTGNIDSSTTAGTCWNIGLIKIANLILSGDTAELNQPEGNDGLTIVLGDYSAANTLTIGATNLVITNGYYNLINSKITGSGTISSTTDLALYGDNSGYSGDVNITSGTLNVNHPNALGSGTTAVVIDDGASISLRSFADSATTIARPITLSGASSAGTSKISFGVSHNCPPYIPDITLSGTFTLQNDATYKSHCPGKLIIPSVVLNGHSMIASDGNAGILVLGDNEIIPEWKEETISDDKPGDILNVDPYRITTLNGVRRSAIVENLGVLKGTGSIKEYLMVRHGGVVSPGLSPGCMTVGTILELYGEYQFEAHDGTACSGYDQLKVGGIVRLTEESNEDNPNPKSGKLNVSLLDGYNLPTGTVMTIIDNQGNEAVKGTFEGLPEGATIKGPNGAVLKISYVGGDGNDVTLTVITAGTPDTGFGLLLNNPMVVLGATTVAAGAILVISRRTKLAAQRVRR